MKDYKIKVFTSNKLKKIVHSEHYEIRACSTDKHKKMDGTPL